MYKFLTVTMLYSVLNWINAQDMFSGVSQNNDIILEYGRLSAHHFHRYSNLVKVISRPKE